MEVFKMDRCSQGSFIKHFSDIEDPRIERHKRYPLIEINSIFFVVRTHSMNDTADDNALQKRCFELSRRSV